MAITNPYSSLTCGPGQEIITPEISDRHDFVGNENLDVITPDDSPESLGNKKDQFVTNSPDANTTFIISPIDLIIHEPAGPFPQIVSRYKYLAQKISDNSWLTWTQSSEYPTVFPSGYTPGDYIVIGIYDIFKELIQP